MGAVDAEGTYIPGYIDFINANFQGDRELVRHRLSEERVPQILRAGRSKPLIQVRRKGMKLPGPDLWSAKMLKRTSDWMEGKGLRQPSAAEISARGHRVCRRPDRPVATRSAVNAAAPPLGGRAFQQSLQRHAFILPYPRPNAVANVIDVFEVESALVGALDRILNALARGRQPAADA